MTPILLILPATVTYSELVPHRANLFGIGPLTESVTCYINYDVCAPYEPSPCWRNNTSSTTHFCAPYEITPRCYRTDATLTQSHIGTDETPSITQVKCTLPRLADLPTRRCIPGAYDNMYNDVCRIGHNTIQYRSNREVKFGCICAGNAAFEMGKLIPRCTRNHGITRTCGMMYLMRCPGCGPNVPTIMLPVEYEDGRPIGQHRCLKCAVRT